MKYLATFYTHYGAMQFHQHCRQGRISVKMKPTPRELSASCGICVLFDAEYAPEIAAYDDMERCYLVTPEGAYVPIE